MRFKRPDDHRYSARCYGQFYGKPHMFSGHTYEKYMGKNIVRRGQLYTWTFTATQYLTWMGIKKIYHVRYKN
jgi:hypothetical protein